MKKSTLITTIAMIVVVVVALSTATYAWFTTNEATYADLRIEIAAEDDLTVVLNGENVYSNGGLVSFTAKDFLDNASASGAGIRAGTWVPNQTTVLNQKPGDPSSFDSCTLSGAASAFATGTIDTATTRVVISNATEVMAPTLIHVKNNTEGTKYVTLKIYIGYKDDAPSKYAASGIAAYLADSTGCVASTLYYLPTASIETSSYTQATFSNGASYTEKVTNGKTFVDSSNQNHVSSISGDVGIASDDTANEKLAGYEYFYTLSYYMGVYNQNVEKNYLTYIWLDAGYLNDNAKGSDIKVVYAFDAQDSAPNP